MRCLKVSRKKDYIAGWTTSQDLNLFILSNKGFMLSYTTDPKTKFPPVSIQTKLFHFSNCAFTDHNRWDGGFLAMHAYQSPNPSTLINEGGNQAFNST